MSFDFHDDYSDLGPYRYPDILDILDMEERKERRKKGILSEYEIENKKQMIVINLILGNFVSQADLRFLYKNGTQKEIDDMDRLFHGIVTAVGSRKTIAEGKKRGYSEGYKSDYINIDGTKVHAIIPTSTPDINIDSDSTTKLHSLRDILQHNLHENFSEAAKYTVDTYPETVIAALKQSNIVNVDYNNCKLVRVESRWDQPLDKFNVDIILNIGVILTIAENTFSTVKRRVLYRLRYTFDLFGKNGQKTCSGPVAAPVNLFPTDKITEQGSWKTTDYLNIVASKDDFPELVRQMLKNIYPQALKNPTRIDGEELVERMSDWLGRKYEGMHLRLREEYLGENGVKGQIYFYDTTIVDEDGYRIEVKAGDIVINTAYIERDCDRNATIIHECSHVYLHLPFFMLQMMAGKPKYSFTDHLKTDIANLKTKAEKDHVKWMEWQAERMTAYIMMEDTNFRKECKRLLALRNNDKSPKTMTWVMQQLSFIYGTSYQMTKIRMIEVGLTEAEGIWNFIDGGKKVPDFGISPSPVSGVVYTIGHREHIELYRKSEEYANVIDSCRYVYVDGHFVLNDPKYVRTTSNYRHYLTAYAVEHINECSLSYRVARNDDQTEYYFGAAARTDKKRDLYNKGYELHAEPGTIERTKENTAFEASSDKWCDLINSFTENARESISIAMKAMGVTQENMAAALGISRKTLNTWLNDEILPVNRIVGICVILGMRMDASMELISLASRPLRRSGVDMLYRSMISIPGKITIERCNEILIENGYEPITHGVFFEAV
ncbi:MAG: helix-turn-helix transcriptional regulator [Oscillospiraceae bacterium]|nr:helix-turn-helix transcriptional regulator [Oscillospiraceae bacterium]